MVAAMMSTVGAPGADGTTYVELVAMEFPTAFVARTEIVSESPDCRFETTHDVAKLLLAWHWPMLLVTVYDCRADPPSVSGVVQDTRAVEAVGASMLRSRGADGFARGITSAEAVFVEASTVAVLVIVTILVSYNLEGSRLVKRALRATVVSARTTPGIEALDVPLEMLAERAVRDCTVTGFPNDPPRSRSDTSYWTNTPSPYVLGSIHETSSVVLLRVPLTFCTATKLGEGIRTSADSDTAPPPRLLKAVTVMLYEAPLTRPTSVQERMEVLQLVLLIVGAVGDEATTE